MSVYIYLVVANSLNSTVNNIFIHVLVHWKKVLIPICSLCPTDRVTSAVIRGHYCQ